MRTGDGVREGGLGGGWVCAGMETADVLVHWAEPTTSSAERGGDKSPGEVSTQRAGSDLELQRGFLMWAQGPPFLPSSTGKDLGATAMEAGPDAKLESGGKGLTRQVAGEGAVALEAVSVAKLDLGGRGLTRQVEEGGACWS